MLIAGSGATAPTYIILGLLGCAGFIIPLAAIKNMTYSELEVAGIGPDLRKAVAEGMYGKLLFALSIFSFFCFGWMAAAMFFGWYILWPVRRLAKYRRQQ